MTLLSSAQKRLFFVDQLSTTSALFNIPIVFKITGNLDMNALENAFQLVLKFHEILRLGLFYENGDINGFIRPIEDYKIKYTTLYPSNDRKVDQVALELIEKKASKKIDLLQEQFFQVEVIITGDHNSYLFLLLHHIVTDEWSNEIILKDLTKFYHSYDRTLLDQKISNSYRYSDYVNQQIELYESGKLESNLNYWQNYLSSAPEVTELSLNKHRPKDLSFDGNTITRYISGSRYQEIINFCQQNNLSLFNFLITVFICLIYRVTGKDNIVIGYPSANRVSPDVEDVVGLFVNPLPLFLKIKNNQTFFDLLEQVRDDILTGYMFQNIPFDVLIEKLGIKRNQNYHPIYQILFTSYKKSESSFLLDNLEIKAVDLKKIFSKFDLSLFCIDELNRIKIEFNFAFQLFDLKFVEAYANIFEMIILSVVKNQYIPINNIVILDHKQTIYIGNESSRKESNCNNIIDMFDALVRTIPNSIAIISGNQNLSYIELDVLSSKIATFMLCNGLREYDVISICLDPDIKMIATIIASIKLGLSYVCIDTECPEDRVDYILRDSNTKLVITSSNYIGKFKEFNVINLDVKFDEILFCKNKYKKISVQNDVMCIIYTSGSTGKPKGVLYKSFSIYNRIKWVAKHYPFEHEEVCVAYANPSFVDFLGEVFIPILNGIKVVLASNYLAREPNKLLNLLESKKVTRINILPSILKVLLEDCGNFTNYLQKIKHWEISGEPLTESLALAILKKFRNSRIINRYGSTEATSIIYNELFITQDGILAHKTKVIDNTKIYVLDKFLNPLPDFIKGEICVSGIALAKGYLNDLDLTESKFIKNSNINTSDVLYKTGDIGYRDENQNIYILGREDNQLKINGFRVDLLEIAKTAELHENVNQAAAVCIKNTNIILYVKVNHNFASFSDELMNYLSNKLPSYMLPYRLTVLDNFPLMANGKINYQMLKDFDNSSKPQLQNNIKSTSVIEKKLLEIWKEVLEKDEIDITSNFFKIGGNSIKAIKLIARIQNTFGCDLPFDNIYKYSSISDLAKKFLIDFSENDGSINNEHEKKVSLITTEVPLSFAQERLWFLEQYTGGTPAYNIPMVFNIKKSADLEILKSAVADILLRHEPLRTVINKKDNGFFYQYVHEDLQNIPYFQHKIVHDLLQLDNYLEQEFNHVFNLENELPIKLTFFELISCETEKNNQFFISIVIHHIAFDGWSLDILLYELSKLYEYKINKRDNLVVSLNLERIEYTYRDFTIWQRNYLSGSILKKQLEYWHRKYENFEPLEIYTDKPRPKEVSYVGDNVPFIISSQISSKLRDLAKNLHTSLYSVLLAGFAILLKFYCNQNDIIIGTPVANRHYKNVANLIGFFSNTLVLRIKIDDSETILRLIQKVIEEVRDAINNQDIPFEKLVEDLKLEKDQSRNPIFQVLFIVQNFGTDLYTESSNFKLKELKKVLEIYKPKSNLLKISRFDITAFIDDSGDCLKGNFNFATKLFEKETILNLINSYTLILEHISQCNCYTNSKLPKISEINYGQSKNYQFTISNQIRCTEDINNYTIHKLIERNADKLSAKSSVTIQDKTYSYVEINTISNTLANYLKKTYEIQSEELVVVFMNRSELFLFTFLAVLKCGSVCIPVDKSLGLKRFQDILHHSKARIILTDSSDVSKILHEDITSNFDSNSCHSQLDRSNDMIIVDVIDLNDLNKRFGKFRGIDINNPNVQITANNLAYILYTSGTSGKPKGVMIKHSSVVNYTYNVSRYIGLDSDDKVDLSSSFSFDFTVTTSLSALILGAHIFLYNNDLNDHEKYLNHLKKYSITFIKLTPGYAELVLDFLIDTKVKKIVLGGEKVNTNILNKIRNLTTNIVIYDEYGPTETTVGAYVVNLSNSLNGSKSNNLDVYDNYRLYIADPNLNLVPKGFVGELYISGHGLAHGYLNEESLTMCNFIKNPFVPLESLDSTHNIVYKTGDVVRFLNNGKIEFIGRKDEQIKLRGYRIELSEIEESMLQHGDITQVKVILRYVGSSNHIVAYFVSKDFTPSSNEIRDFLLTKIPDYMIPSFFIELNKIPLNHNGKLNFNALPNPIFSNLINIQPRNEMESMMRSIWSELLGLEEQVIGVFDNFFDLGGHSLATIKLVTYINKHFDKKISIKDIFRTPTIAAICEFIF
jgi:amino acid adenylation domain-containing protein